MIPASYTVAGSFTQGIPDTGGDGLVENPRACERISYIVEAQIHAIQAQIESIDLRLASLGDSDEDRIEGALLRAARRLLLRDLRELVGFSDASCSAAPAATVSGAVVEA